MACLPVTHQREIFIVATICSLALVFATCVDQQKQTDLRGPAYAAATTCIACHKEIYDTYSTTAHSLSSQPPSKNAIKGDFEKDSNVFYYRPTLKVAMEERDSGFYQVAYIDNVERQSERFDLVVGSGTKGQSYLYWHNDKAFQLPVSYFVPGKAWVNSPAFPPQHVQFNRNIPIGCFECHSSYIRKTGTSVEGNNLVDHFDKQQVIYGIDCQRCHGPAAAHVDFHGQNPAEKRARYITNVSTLPEERQLDMCATCHSGARETYKATFNFKPGDTLSKFLFPDSMVVNTDRIDVHGKQYQLLRVSNCFLKSNTITCSTCHDPHITERGNTAVFSTRCKTCHSSPDHTPLNLTGAQKAISAGNCIDCHMPAQPSALITMTAPTQINPIPAMVRTHLIGIYTEATKKFLLENK